MENGNEVVLLVDTNTINHSFVTGELFILIENWQDHYGFGLCIIENIKGKRLMIATEKIEETL